MGNLFQRKHERTESNQPRTPEQQLWVSVLTKAADGAIYTTDWLEARKAIAWFKSKNKDFKEVCELAGYNPDYVADKMQRPVHEREENMQAVRRGLRVYVQGKRPNCYHSHYRTGYKRGPYKRRKKHLTGNAYYAAKAAKEMKKRNLYYSNMGSKGGRPRIYNNV